jgi:choline-sulfatase
MIKRDHLKYQYYGEDMPEVLFDLEKDPGEIRDEIDNPMYEGHLQWFRKRRKQLCF